MNFSNFHRDYATEATYCVLHEEASILSQKGPPRLFILHQFTLQNFHALVLS